MTGAVGACSCSKTPPWILLSVVRKLLIVLCDGAVLNGDKVMVPLSEESGDSTDALLVSGPGAGMVSWYGS